MLRRTRAEWWLLVGTFAALSASCSLVYDGERHLPDPLASDDFCHEVALIYCDAERACCAAIHTDCVGTVETACHGERETFDALVGSSVTDYDPEEAGRWAAEARALAQRCDPQVLELLTPNHYLPRFFAGAVPEGGVCLDGSSGSAQALSCVRPLACTSLGVCAPPTKGMGEACLGFDCAEGLFCRNSEPKRCEPRYDVDQPCASANECASFVCYAEMHRCIDSTNLRTILCL